MDVDLGLTWDGPVRSQIGGVGDSTCHACQTAKSTSMVLLVSLSCSVETEVHWCSGCEDMDSVIQYYQYFPCHTSLKRKFAFSNQLMELYRDISNQYGLAMLRYIESILHTQPALPCGYSNGMIYERFREVVIEFRRSMSHLERLQEVGCSDLFRHCRCCPRPGEPGLLHIGADGNFGAFRILKKKQHVRDRKIDRHFFMDPKDVKDYLAREPPRKKPDKEKLQCPSNFDALTNTHTHCQCYKER